MTRFMYLEKFKIVSCVVMRRLSIIAFSITLIVSGLEFLDEAIRIFVGM